MYSTGAMPDLEEEEESPGKVQGKSDTTVTL